MILAQSDLIDVNKQDFPSQDLDVVKAIAFVRGSGFSHCCKRVARP